MSGSSLRLLVIGKTGAGKSSLCNALVKAGDEEDAFGVSEFASTSHTQRCQRVRRQVRGRHLTVVDSPGTIDTSANFNPLKDIDSVMSFSPDGYHACLLVLRLDSKLTKEEEEAIKTLKKILPFTSFCVVVFTHGDHVHNDDQKFAETVAENRGQIPYLNLLLRECGDRMAMVDTGENRDETVLDQQLKSLLTLVETRLDNEVLTERDMQAAREYPSLKRDRLNVMIVGEDRAGKSSVANSLLESEEFPVNDISSSSSAGYLKRSKFIVGKETTVVEVSAGFPTNPSTAGENIQEKERMEHARETLEAAVQECDDGFHAFVAVIRADSLRPNQLNPTIRHLRSIFTETGFNSRLVVAFTHSRNEFNEDAFTQRLTGERMAIPDLKDLLKSCGDRFVVVNVSETRSMMATDTDVNKLRLFFDEVSDAGPIKAQVDGTSLTILENVLVACQLL